MASAHVREHAIPVLTPDQALRREPEDLFIEDGAEVNVSVNSREHSRYFSRVKAKSINDLQTLGLVPRGLREDRLREAIAKDDVAALQTAREMLSRSASADCECAASVRRDRLSYRDQLARAYSNVRRDVNPALAELVSVHYKTEFRWDSVHLQSIRGWATRVSRLAEQPLVVGVFQDIRVGRRARLVLDRTCTTVYARGVYIHETGTLVHKGSYLRIWASSVQRWDDWASIILQQEVPWALAS